MTGEVEAEPTTLRTGGPAMWTDDDLMKVMRGAPATVDDALKAVQRDDVDPIDLDAFNAAADVLGVGREQHCIDQLRGLGLLDAFVAALSARGIEADPDRARAVASQADELAASGRFDREELWGFLGRAGMFRCRIEVDGQFAGTGCLVGPGLVLTAWHVVRREGPGKKQDPEPTVSVVLADRSTHAVQSLKYASECGDSEWSHQAPRADDEVKDRHDVALLALSTSAARHLGYAPFPEKAPEVASKLEVYLLDFPAGEDKDFARGTVHKIRNVTSRLYHTVETAGGSSGGACFDDRYELLGLHQGIDGAAEEGRKRGRLVPLRLFRDDVAKYISEDVAPRHVWSLDGETSQLVIGRDVFVDAVAAAGDERTRVRGVRVKRRRPEEADEAGLGFSYRILSELLLRRGGAHSIVTVPLDEPLDDLVDDLRKRVVDGGLELDASVASRPAGPPAANEAGALDRAHRFAAAVDAAAAKAGRVIWFFIENPSLPLTETVRLQFEGFVAASLNLPRIRLVVTGLETVPLAGLEFSSAAAAAGEGSAGFVVEYIGTFERAQLLDCLELAAMELAGARDAPAVRDSHADAALYGHPHATGVYADSVLPEVVRHLQGYLGVLSARGRARRGG